MSYRLLVVDIDGTLLGKEGIISDEDKAALAAAKQAGVKVCLSTGRAIQGCQWIVDELSLDGYHIFFDGALVSGPNDELYVEPLVMGVVKEVVDFVRKNDIYLELYSATDYFVEWENWATEIHRSYFKLEPMVVDFAKLRGGEKFVKGGLITRDDEEKAKAQSFRNRFDRSLRFSAARSPAYPGVEFINLLAPDVSKGKALTALAAHLDVPLSEVMAIGDGTNDISLLSIAGLAVAMGNAPDEVKAVAHRVTEEVGKSGVAAAVNKFLL